MKKQEKKPIGTREIQNNVKMVLKGHNACGYEIWVTEKYFNKLKSNDKKTNRQ